MSDSESAEGKECQSRCCHEPAAGVSPLCGLPLCQQHLDKDSQRVASRIAEFVDKVSCLQNVEHIQELTREKEMLAAEMNEVTAAFDQVLKTLDQWRKRTMSCLQAAHDTVAGRLKDSKDAEEAVREISVARNAGNMKKGIELVACMESWLDEAVHRLSDFERLWSKNQKSCVRCVGDVSGGVGQLHLLIDRHMTGVMQQCRLLQEEEADATVDKSLACRLVASVDNLESSPRRLTVCDNTTGFAGDSMSDRVVRAAESGAAGADGQVALAQPCIIVAFDSSASNRLLVTSLAGDERFEIRCSPETNKTIHGLHWDSQRQSLFVAHIDSVKRIDLSGRVLATTHARNFEQSLSKFADIDGNSSTLFVLNTEGPRIVLVDKDSQECKLAIDLKPWILNEGSLTRMCAIGNKLLVTDAATGQVHKLCSITHQLIASYPATTHGSSIERLKCPRQVAVNNRGLLAVIDLDGKLLEDKKIVVLSGNHSVHILANDGTVLDTVTSAVVEDGSKRNSSSLSSRPSAVLFAKSHVDILVVAYSQAKKLLVFELS